MQPATSLKAAAGADKTLISGVHVFDVFEGGKLAGEGKKSLAIEVTLQPLEHTLTDKDIEAVCQKIIADVKKATGGEVAVAEHALLTKRDQLPPH